MTSVQPVTVVSHLCIDPSSIRYPTGRFNLDKVNDIRKICRYHNAEVSFLNTYVSKKVASVSVVTTQKTKFTDSMFISGVYDPDSFVTKLAEDLDAFGVVRVAHQVDPKYAGEHETIYYETCTEAITLGISLDILSRRSFVRHVVNKLIEVSDHIDTSYGKAFVSETIPELLEHGSDYRLLFTTRSVCAGNLIDLNESLRDSINVSREIRRVFYDTNPKLDGVLSIAV